MTTIPLRVTTTGTPALDLSAFPKPPPWMASALCAQVDPELFFPTVGENPNAARKVCMACPVKSPCLAYAVDLGEQFGVYGGRTAAERRGLRRSA